MQRAAGHRPVPAATRRICIVGMGTRGLSVLERLCANASDADGDPGDVRVLLVDPHLGEGGRVWHRGQPATLLMNTVASQVTMFADDSVDCAGPIVAGPSLYEWARFMTFIDPGCDLPPQLRPGAAALTADTYPSRALYGHYLVWVLDHLIRNAPPRVTIELFAQAAVDVIDASDGLQRVVLAGGTVLDEVTAVVLAQGHVTTQPTATQSRLARFAAANELAYLPPGSPAEAALDAIAPATPTAVRGLGLNFFDHLALLTTGRGGVFGRQPDGRLGYRPSGLEPRLIAGSRRGVPHRARGENQKGVSGRHTPLLLTPRIVDELRARAGTLRFAADVWPLIDREVRAVYYAALITQRACRCDAERFLRAYAAQGGVVRQEVAPWDYTDSAGDEAVLARFGIPPRQRWSWRRIVEPYGDRCFAGPAAYRSWLLDHLRDDVAQARLGNVDGPVKAALDVLRDLRNEIRLVVDHGGLSGDSYRDEVQGWYTSFNAYVSIGPPVRRIEEMIALIEAGVLEVIGPQLQIDCGAGHFVVRSSVTDAPLRADAVIEAWLPEPDVRRSRDPLVRNLLARGECAPYRIPVDGGGEYETGGLAVSPRPFRVLDAAGNAHPRRFAFGVPTEAVHWVTAAGIRPGLNSVIVQDADAIARACLRIDAAVPGGESERLS